MTDEELDHLEALFRNPPSFAMLAEHGLRLIGELRSARGATALVGAIVEQSQIEAAMLAKMAEPPVDPLAAIVQPKPKKKGRHE